MEDIQIIKQLLNGNHLEPKEVKRAEELVNILTRQLTQLTK